MFIDQYYSVKNGTISFTREQGSNFAKHVAGDFNPLHDSDAKRFCIPGDLLFSLIVAKYGLNQHMECIFSGMVLEGTELVLPEPSPELLISDEQGKHYMTVSRWGDNSANPVLIANLARNYVEFSGHTFPHILVPLLAEQNVMFNPDRPMVIYERMAIDLDTLDIEAPTLEVDHNELEISGKRGDALIAFNLVESGKVVGRGKKRIILSGLREYDKSVMDAAVEKYRQKKQDFVPV